MTRLIQGIILGGTIVVVGVVIIVAGLVSLPTPSFPSFSKSEVSLTLPDEARIVAVEPISLDCRARVHAEVPIDCKRTHEIGGFEYRVDRIQMNAIGDVDTCVDGSAAQITHSKDGTTEVVIPGESILFVRPRVNTVKTAESVNIDKDQIGKLVDAFPWVDDNLGLAPKAYAYAQVVIGSSECMRTAYGVTEAILIDAYRQQLIDDGVDPEQLTVRIDGEPDFENTEEFDLGDIEMTVGSGDDISCVASEDVGGVSSPQGL